MALQGVTPSVTKTVQGAKNPTSWANEMKNIRKQRLQRQVLQDPSMASKLVAVENSPVYNSRGELIQTLGTGT